MESQDYNIRKVVDLKPNETVIIKTTTPRGIELNEYVFGVDEKGELIMGRSRSTYYYGTHKVQRQGIIHVPVVARRRAGIKPSLSYVSIYNLGKDVVLQTIPEEWLDIPCEYCGNTLLDITKLKTKSPIVIIEDGKLFCSSGCKSDADRTQAHLKRK